MEVTEQVKRRLTEYADAEQAVLDLADRVVAEARFCGLLSGGPASNALRAEVRDLAAATARRDQADLHLQAVIRDRKG